MKNLLYFVLALTLASVFSCKKGNNADVTLALSLAGSDPDSSLSILRGIRPGSLNQKDYADYSLAYYWALDKSGLDVNDDSLIRNAYLFYQNQPSSPQYPRAMYYMGKYFSLVDSSEQAERCLDNAINTANLQKDTMTSVLAMERLSRIMKYHDLTKAMDLAREATRQYSMLKDMDSTNLYWFLINEVICFSYRQYEEAVKIGYKALNLAYEMGGDSDMVSRVHQNIAFAFQYGKKTDSALVHAKQAYNLAPNKTFNLTLALADAYMDADSIGNTFPLLQEYPIKSGTNAAYYKYFTLLKASIKAQDIALSLMFTDSTTKAIERMYFKELAAKTNYYNTAINEAKEKARIEGVSSMKSYLLCLTALLSIFIVTYILHLFIIYRKKAEEKFRNENEKQQLEIAFKDKQLEIMRDYILQKIRITGKIEDMISKPYQKVILTEEDWDEIEVYLESSSNAFVSRIKHEFDYLTDEDFHLLYLLRLKLSTKNLSTIYNISEDSVKHKLFVYKSKIGLSANGPSLRSYIEKF